MNIPVKLMDNQDLMERYVEDNSLQVFVDYDDELSKEQLERVIKGESDDIRCEIEENCSLYGEYDLPSYKETMSETLGISLPEIDDWFDSEDGFYPQYSLDDYDWKKLLSRSDAYITATVEDAVWRFDSWAYGNPIEYNDVKEALRILGINPKEFRDLATGGSLTAGPGKMKGYFPNLPNRVPAVNIRDLYENMCTLYDGQLCFCLGDIENALAIKEDDSKYIVFKKGTNVVMYAFGGGAGITEVELLRDVEVPRKDVDIDLDSSYRYGIQECYGFTRDFWMAGAIQSK